MAPKNPRRRRDIWRSIHTPIGWRAETRPVGGTGDGDRRRGVGGIDRENLDGRGGAGQIGVRGDGHDRRKGLPTELNWTFPARLLPSRITMISRGAPSDNP